MSDRNDDLIGRFETRSFPAVRLWSDDVCEVGLRKHHVKALLELDVTRVRHAIHEYRNRTSRKLSFTAWFVKCAAQAVSEHPRAHVVRSGRAGLVIFDDVDVTVLVERVVEGGQVPLPVVVRRADKKSLNAIHDEVRAAQERRLVQGDVSLGRPRNRLLQAAALAAPAFLRRAFWTRVVRSPSLTKKVMGTVAVTSVGAYGRSSFWPIPISIFPLCFALGTIVRKPGVVEGRIEARECLCLTVLVDHDVIDGAPAARFLARLSELVENGWGLQ
jgi:pyruvate/2-oxoglutarate dehydrogenase complex dihydrolipoamide acyltransferase (E2) component